MKNRDLAFIGIALTILGTFCPLITVPFLGSVNFYSNGGLASIDGLLLLGFSAWVAADLFKENYLSIKWKSFFIIGDILVGIFLTYMNVQKIKNEYKSEMAGNPFSEFGEALISPAGLSWGWAIMLIGAGILLFASLKLYSGKEK